MVAPNQTVVDTYADGPASATLEDPNIGNPPPLPLSLGKIIREDWIAHGRDWTLPGFRAVAVHRFGVWRMQVNPKVLRAPLSMLYRSLYRKVRNTYGIELPYTVKLGRRVVIEHQSNIVIHGYCEIGDDSIIRQGVTMGLRHVNRPFDAPTLGKGVNIGAGAKLLVTLRSVTTSTLVPMQLC